VIEEPIKKHTRLAGISSSLTACEAFAIADPAAKGYDANAFCHLMSAGERIDGEGASDLWELFYVLPNARAHATFGVGIDEHCDPDSEWDRRYLLESLRPFAHHRSGNILGQLIRSGVFDIGHSGNRNWSVTLPCRSRSGIRPKPFGFSSPRGRLRLGRHPHHPPDQDACHG